jgi:hypothetical protein
LSQYHDRNWRVPRKVLSNSSKNRNRGNKRIERRVDLTVADLVPCPFNRWGSPSWLDLFSQLK